MGDKISGAKLHRTADIRLGKSIQLSAHLLKCILIARGTGMEQKQIQKFLEFVNILLPPPHWWCSHHPLQIALGLRDAMVEPCPCSGSMGYAAQPQPKAVATKPRNSQRLLPTESGLRCTMEPEKAWEYRGLWLSWLVLGIVGKEWLGATWPVIWGACAVKICQPPLARQDCWVLNVKNMACTQAQQAMRKQSLQVLSPGPDPRFNCKPSQDPWLPGWQPNCEK